MYIRQTPNRSFKDWLKMPIETKDGLVYDVNEENCWSQKPITHYNFVNSVYNDIIKIIHKNGHTITYKKAFKIKLAKILYSLSDNSNYGPTL